MIFVYWTNRNAAWENMIILRMKTCVFMFTIAKYQPEKIDNKFEKDDIV